MSKPYDVLAVGELNPDLVLTGIRAEAPVLGTEQEVGSLATTLGSSTAICTVGLSRLGLKTALVAVVGDDEYGKFCLAALKRERVDTRHVVVDAALQTGVTVSLSYPEDRLLATFPGSMRALQAEAVPDDLLARAGHLHVASFFLQTALQPGLAALFARAKAQGLSTSLDTGWDPDERWERDKLEPVFPHLDVFLPNAAELAALAGDADPAVAAAWALERGARYVALKRGGQGATLYRRNAPPSHHTGFAARVVDTTGAGDAFNAGFLYGFLKGWREAEALELANACGALAVTSVGGTGGFGSLQDVRRFLAGRPESS